MMAQAGSAEPQQDIWVFGYGSLAHTPNFDYSHRVEGCIRGYRRVFWQGSTDHRGTPQRPGRTVTLTPDAGPAAVTWGVAYALAGSQEEQQAALEYLEWREKQYDERVRLDVYDKDGQVLVRQALVYIASPTNNNYLGPADPRDIAVQIATTAGPSGHNSVYLFRLADEMRRLGVDDPELYELEVLVRQHMAAAGGLDETSHLAGASTASAAAVCGSSSGVDVTHGSATHGEEGQEQDERERQMRRWHQKQQEAAAARRQGAHPAHGQRDPEQQHDLPHHPTPGHRRGHEEQGRAAGMSAGEARQQATGAQLGGAAPGEPHKQEREQGRAPVEVCASARGAVEGSG